MSRLNHLADEKSPYLLQHVHNPVDWRPWNDKTFRKAREEDKPIFLSIGYATCQGVMSWLMSLLKTKKWPKP